MPIKISAGLLMYRFNNGKLEVLLGHPGGPYYREKDSGYWGIPKGETEGEEHLIETAIREFIEETGLLPDIKDIIPLGGILDDNTKLICIWAFQGSCEIPFPVNSNLFKMEWPEGSGCVQFFPELDRLEFFSIKDAITKIEPVQRDFILCLEKRIILRLEKHLAKNYRDAI